MTSSIISVMVSVDSSQYHCSRICIPTVDNSVSVTVSVYYRNRHRICVASYVPELSGEGVVVDIMNSE